MGLCVAESRIHLFYTKITPYLSHEISSLYAEVLKYDKSKQLNEQRLNHKLGAAPLQLVKFL